MAWQYKRIYVKPVCGPEFEKNDEKFVALINEAGGEGFRLIPESLQMDFCLMEREVPDQPVAEKLGNPFALIDEGGALSHLDPPPLDHADGGRLGD